MSAERLAVYSTVYPDAAPFLADWHASLRTQTDAAFDLWIGADAIARADVEAAVGAPVDARWIPALRDESPAALRGRAMHHLAARYHAVVFVDADDVLEPERVAAAREALAAREVDACALRLMDVDGHPLDDVLAPAAGEDAAAALPWRNVFGLSNTAYRATTLRRCLPVPPTCRLPDWLLATRAWLLGATLGFDRTPRMRYRQHAANMAPTRRPVTARMLLDATAHVLAHHQHVLAAPWPDRVDADAGRLERVRAAHVRARDFCRAMTAAPERLVAYLDALNLLPDARVPRAWWWMVAHPDLEELWSS